MSNSTQQSIVISHLLPSTSYTLSYALPLLLISIVLTFAGAFLTLDRTRSFPPRYDVIPGAFDKKKTKKIQWLFQGGVGGLAIGYAFGVHLSMFLALLIPSVSSSASLGPKSFLAVWLLSAIVTTFLAGRWKYAALAFSGISGGGTMAVSLSVIVHPSLSARIVLAAIFLPFTVLLAVLPLPNIQHGAFRLSTSATGAFGLVLSIALLSHVDSWATVWERLWIRDGESWGSGKEKGLSAAWFLFLSLGICVDWLLKRRFGENPDEKWDHYLANYAANLPNPADRAGYFQPLSNSFWARILGRQKNKDNADMLFPSERDLKAGSKPSNPALAASLSSRPFNFQPNPGFLKKGRSHSQTHLQTGRKRERVKFGRAYSDSSDSDDSDDLQSPLATPTLENTRPWLKEKRSTSSNLSGSVTLNGVEDAKKSEGGAPDYSDHEEDVTAHVDRIKRRVSRNTPGWSPDFLARHRNGASAGSNRSIPTPGAASVPATPSLIKAMERVAVAQREAFDPQGEEVRTKAGLPDSSPSSTAVEEAKPMIKEAEQSEKRSGARWQDFWREVKVKAGQR